MPHESKSGCPDCGHALMEHDHRGCTHGIHRRDPDDFAAAYEVCPCRRGRHGRHDSLDEEAE